ncbi:hypothetical protein C7Y66_20485, partial [Chroococcidiopsis sp. CCALA 051]|uniref:hypothetical protein n=1 Tax=Chroococcidiopsis sp. CCALA 051 TaxID=869949 RepID=UPI000D2C4377
VYATVIKIPFEQVLFNSFILVLDKTRTKRRLNRVLLQLLDMLRKKITAGLSAEVVIHFHLAIPKRS